jgi:hypothetical protein
MGTGERQYTCSIRNPATQAVNVIEHAAGHCAAVNATLVTTAIISWCYFTKSLWDGSEWLAGRTARIVLPLKTRACGHKYGIRGVKMDRGAALIGQR